ncbi:MAG: 4Fe-4S dicluster domain-containing protein [Planctomycetaceae bacterium]|nr:4Fe-4S dicluster domain-containing protein [Planctomycetaceae bacterium]
MPQQEKLQQKAKEILLEKKADVVIGYGKVETGNIGAVFITDPERTGELVWNNLCTTNLSVYLKRKEIKKLGKPCIIVKGCDAKALAVLEIENQIDRSAMTVIGVECFGVQDRCEPQYKCASCNVQLPPHCDFVIERDTKQSAPQGSRYEKLEMLDNMDSKERFEYWKQELSRCIKCYACRQNCPMCYCDVCVVDKNRPIRIDTSATLKGNFAWNILRAFHLAGRCVGCGACSAACPAGIDLDLLNLTLAKASEENFGYIAGVQRNVEPLVGTFSPDDKEEFIR